MLLKDCFIFGNVNLMILHRKSDERECDNRFQRIGGVKKKENEECVKTEV